ncbi:PAS domain-containing protein [Mariniflexile soesokkakense]|uniref:PAS domain-containing protein n=1 Tax=Mariniflexile soesokkakense TaxID=1343160 RepID=A0ABV0ACM7_9FLAO
MKLIKQKLWREKPESILEDFLENQSSISIIDNIGRIIYANNKFCKLIEIPESRIQGELNTILKSELHANPIYNDLWTVIKSGQIWKGILSDYTSSGTLYKLDTTIIPGRNSNGEIDKFVAFYFNVKTRYDAKNSVGSKKLTMPFSGNMSTSVHSINVFGEILISNQGFGKLSATEVVGCSLYSFFSPIFHDMVKKIVKNVFDDGKLDQFETIGINSVGANTIFVSQIGPVINNRGIVVSATISTQEVKDISGIKQKLMQEDALKIKFKNC